MVRGLNSGGVWAGFPLSSMPAIDSAFRMRMSVPPSSIQYSAAKSLMPGSLCSENGCDNRPAPRLSDLSKPTEYPSGESRHNRAGGGTLGPGLPPKSSECGR